MGNELKTNDARKEELQEIQCIVGKACSIVTLVQDCCDLKEELPLANTLYCVQKYLYEAMERINRLW